MPTPTSKEQDRWMLKFYQCMVCKGKLPKPEVGRFNRCPSCWENHWAEQEANRYKCSYDGCDKPHYKSRKLIGFWQSFCKEHYNKADGWSESDSWNHAVDTLSRGHVAT